MYYISLDLEWNQAYAQKALSVQKRLSARLRGDVIQIGAVKLNEQMQICGSYSVIVKPKYFCRLHKHVSALTGITQQQMDAGVPLPQAAENFHRWCGKDFAFLTWGPDDVPMLKDNLHVHDQPVDWLNRTYDLQVIFNKQTDGQMNKQRSLEYAMEYYSIAQTLPAHDALNDAYFTALVAAKMDLKEGVRTYDEPRGKFLVSDVLGDADAGDDGYVAISELLDDPAIKAPVCPICKRAMEQKERTLHSKGQRYSMLYRCARDGDMLLVVRLQRNFNDTWRAKRTIEHASEEQCAQLRRKLDACEVRKKTRRRRAGKRRATGLQSTPAQESPS